VQGSGDKILWIPSKRKLFELKSYYHVLSTPASFPISLEEYLKS
jgi:hypothetical protein